MSETDLKRLFQLHAQPLQLYLRRKGSDLHLAADLTQESFVRLAEQRDLGAIGNVQAWLYRTAQNLFIDHLRQQQRRKTDSVGHDELAGILEDVPTLDERSIEAQHRQRLQQAVARLPERTGEIFRLNRLEGLTYAEVAARLGISESSVQKHLAKALAEVMRLLQVPT
ncbi:sigma-70 family RNA polymerase sigma factor [Pseudomonas sp. NPDC007930]|uniref:RNA polymerase sigma factor n=1 Tax=Pseudomonas sp. NPDC007930 TaxID=3364417 RepID=UPI0036E28149